MKVTKGKPSLDDKKVIAFYTGLELVFRDVFSDNNCALCNKVAYKGEFNFEYYLKIAQDNEGFIAFYEGDTIIIEL